MKRASRLLTALPWLLLALISWQPNVLAAPIPGLEPTKSWDLDGYIKYMGALTSPDSSSDILDHLLHQRFNFEYRFDRQLRVNVSMRNRVFYGDSADIPGYADVIGEDSGYWDLTSTWLDSGSWVGNTQFDRAYLDWRPSEFDGGNWQVRAGRFRVNWAMSTLWNPNDIFNAYSIYDIDYEERSGVDALLVSRKLGFASALDFVYNPNSESELSSYAMRYLTNYQGWDLQGLIGKSGFDHVIGAGFAGELFGAGFRGEFSYFDPQYERWPIERRVVDAGGSGSPVSINMLAPQTLSSTNVCTLEMDYSFSSARNWMVRGSMLHISNPTESDSALLYLNLPLTARTLSFSQWTSYLDVSFDISALNRVTFSSSYYDDGSYFVGASTIHSLANNWSLLLVLQRFDGSSSSLFGQTPSSLGSVQLKWSF